TAPPRRVHRATLQRRGSPSARLSAQSRASASTAPQYSDFARFATRSTARSTRNPPTTRLVPPTTSPAVPPNSSHQLVHSASDLTAPPRRVHRATLQRRGSPSARLSAQSRASASTAPQYSDFARFATRSTARSTRNPPTTRLVPPTTSPAVPPNSSHQRVHSA